LHLDLSRRLFADVLQLPDTGRHFPGEEVSHATELGQVIAATCSVDHHLHDLRGTRHEGDLFRLDREPKWREG
jgi:hypothetical protein